MTGQVKPCVLCSGKGRLTLCRMKRRGYDKFPNSPCICAAGQRAALEDQGKKKGKKKGVER